MRPADVEAAERLSAEAFHAVALRAAPRGAPEPERRRPDRAARWAHRTQALLRSDPAGCWVAEVDGALAGFATSAVRERLWVLVTFAVGPDLQGRGVGRALLERAERAGAGCDRALLSASDDPGALRRYWSAGFALHPQLRLSGPVRRSALPVVHGVRDGDLDSDRGWMDDLDRDLRGGPHGADHDHLAAMAGCLLVDDARRGYAWTSASETFVVAARDEATATRLLQEAVARGEEEFTVSHVTTANRWAVDVAMAAGLALGTEGHLGVRGGPPPAPYVHNGALL